MQLTKGEARYLRSLQQKKVRDREKKFVVEGWRALDEVLKAGAAVEYVAVGGPGGDFAPVRQELQRRGVPVREADREVLARLGGAAHGPGVLALVRQRTFSLRDVLTERARLVVAADGVADPGNVGTLLRTCDWFGADGVLLGKGSVELHNDKVVRSSVGSILHLPVAEDVDLAPALRDARGQGFSVVAASGDAPSDYRAGCYGPRNLLVLGSEARGASAAVREAADLLVSIPRYGRVESLNVGVACGILLAHLRTVRYEEKDE